MPKASLCLLLLLLLTGCANNAVDLNEIHDDRTSQGCVVVAAEGQSYMKMARGELCKVFCSDKLPINFVLTYSRNGCEVNINNLEEIK